MATAAAKFPSAEPVSSRNVRAHRSASAIVRGEVGGEETARSPIPGHEKRSRGCQPLMSPQRVPTDARHSAPSGACLGERSVRLSSPPLPPPSFGLLPSALFAAATFEGILSIAIWRHHDILFLIRRHRCRRYLQLLSSSLSFFDVPEDRSTLFHTIDPPQLGPASERPAIGTSHFQITSFRAEFLIDQRHAHGTKLYARLR